jgi:hypothetical protein
VSERIEKYYELRGLPAADGTSAFSPYLALGVLSPRQCLHAAMEANRGRASSGRKGVTTWIGELIGRDFYRHVLIGYPRVCMNRPFRVETDKLLWRYDERQFEAWCAGRTGIRVYGSHNTFERLVLIDNQASGLEITGKEGWTPSYNLVLNCDSYLNFDPQTNGEDADGFAAKFNTLGPGNVFRGLSAWSYSDDGYDFWHATHPVLIENCWSFDNGFYRPEWEDEVSGSWRGDGLGFKLGQDAAELVPNHVVAFGNKAFGIDENGNGSTGGVTINNATLLITAKDGNPMQIQLNDGRPHTVRNTIAFDVDGSGVTSFDGAVDDAFNTWYGLGASAADFVNIEMTQLFADAMAPREPDGSLPAIRLHLDPSSHLIDAGTDVGLPYYGTAPDLGAFEVVPSAVPTVSGWGVVTMTLVVLTAGTRVYARRSPGARSPHSPLTAGRHVGACLLTCN